MARGGVNSLIKKCYKALEQRLDDNKAITLFLLYLYLKRQATYQKIICYSLYANQLSHVTIDKLVR